VTASRATPAPHGIRRIERWLVGIAMAIVAWVLERVVVRGMKKRGEPTEVPREPTTLRSRGGQVDADDQV
jgi:hypothetical protein